MPTWFRGGRRKPAAADGAAGLGVPAQPGPAQPDIGPQQPDAPLPQADVVLLTRTGCHLCEQAEQLVGPAASGHGASLAVVDVDRDEGLRSRYTNHVPVLFVRGQLLDYWHVDEQRLADALAGRPVAAPPAL